MDGLTIPRLLQIIDTTRIDPEIMARCREALRLRYRGKTDQALELGRTVVRMAAKARCVNKRDSAAEAQRRTSMGIALLYLAYIQHLSESPRVRLTGQMAITWLNTDDHNRMLTELAIARLMLDEGYTEVAVEHYRAALSLLSNLVHLYHRKNNIAKEKEYFKLYQLTEQVLSQIPLFARRVTAEYERLAEEVPEPDWLDQVPIPSELVWPGDNPVGLHLMPIQSAESNQAILSPNFKPVLGGMDYIEIKQVSLNGQLYQINVAQKVGNRFFMHVSQSYYAFQFAVMQDPPTLTEPCYVLVRRFDSPQRSESPIVILIPEEEQAWLVSSQPDGAAETIVGEREWTFYEGGPKITESKVQVVGAVVAILTPMSA